jgi:hypothetical protein
MEQTVKIDASRKLTWDVYVGVRLSSEIISKIDEIRRACPEIPSRSVIIRELLLEALNRRENE